MPSAVPDVYELDPAEIRSIEPLFAELRRAADARGDDALVQTAHVHGGLLPKRLLAVLSDFRRFGNPHGVLTLRNLPVTAGLPPTPSTAESVADSCTPSVAALLLVMSRLGDPIAYAEEKRGALVQDVCPVPGEEDQQQNTGSVYFKLHSENAFLEHRPDFIGLLCLREDHERSAASITSSIRQALPLLTDEQITVLREPRFRTRLAPSFCRDGREQVYLPPVPVLAGPERSPTLCVDFDDTAPCDEVARTAFDALHEALQKVRREFVLRPGDLAIVDNSTAVHGRSAFTPRYDGKDRWLQRLFVVHSIRPALGQLEPGSVYRCSTAPR
ncbi:TauD/TfdA family dioxygenase [Streptomyces collinus]|uniref:TauD/TfdA family dioxygenase n=1 Tax=Streptomyces collinus TaxID=42684 RepID=UPI00294246E7|nr:TauD/TfdA family dioxygenase [Streptomyces collinus]